jgi:hypothetical protein
MVGVISRKMVNDKIVGRDAIMLSIKHVTRLSLVALAVALSFDLLFWRRNPGISFLVFVILCLAGGALVTWWEGFRPARSSLLLLVPILFFSTITFVRIEPATLFTSFLLVLTCMSVLALTWRGGKWTLYSLSDYVMGFLRLAGSALARPVLLFFFHPTDKPAPAKTPAVNPIHESPSPIVVLQSSQDVAIPSTPNTRPVASKITSRRVLSILRGVLLAVPVIAVLAALLASADPIFSNNLDAFLRLFRIGNLGEYIFRGIYIMVGAYLLIGVYLHALGPSHDEELIGLDKPWLRPFLGWTEAAIVLGAVDMLFAFFVAIQARYFFGGQANINTTGFTYAEYARRGFNELVAVAVISLLIFLALSSITRREAPVQKRTFTALGVGLVVLVGVILISAYQRLLLYETVYGFTRIRTYTHVFMVWVGVLLAITLVLDLVGRLRGFALAVALVGLGFGASLSLLNVDAFIARENIARTQAGSDLDGAYLATLTDDAVPALVQGFTNRGLSQAQRDQLGAVLACRAFEYKNNPGDSSWPAFVVSKANARSLINLHMPELSAYPVKIYDNRSWQVMVAGVPQNCFDYSTAD